MSRLIGSVDKALLALQRLGEMGPEGASLSRLAADLAMNKASLHHTLSVLRHRGFVEQDRNSNYRLGQSALSLADSYLHDDSFCQMHGALKQLSLAVNEICHLGILVGEDIVYVHKVVPRTSINTWSTVGFRNPALTTALGRAIVCQKYLDFESFSQAFPTPLFERTRHTLTALKDIWQELVMARKRGYAREINEYVVGTSCLSVAVLRGHKPIAAISVTGPTERLEGKHEQDLIGALRKYVTPRLPTGLSLQLPTERMPRRVAISPRAIYVVSR
ncbi:MAG TPA: IclR family transcriptional regulator [Rhizomicrobium sp.]|nr:IclR family transcriptional regulator [Rhizomicrobium sp.]